MTMRTIAACFLIACLCLSIKSQGRGSIVSGTVLQDRNGLPISGATVTLGGRNPIKATTDNNGRFSFDMVAAGRYLLSVTSDGYFVPSGVGSASPAQRFGLS